LTIIEMLQKSAEKYPAKTAIIYKESRVSYSELYDKTAALAAFLVDTGIKKGDRIGLLVEKTPEAIIGFLGAAAAGGVVFPMDYNQLPRDHQFTVDLAHPSALIVASSLQPLLTGLRTPCPDQKIVVIGKQAKIRYPAWDEIVSRSTPRMPGVEIAADDVVYLNFTSGTTGTPKGAITTHNNIYWNTRASVEALGLVHEDVHLCMFPVFGHPHELFARPLLLGGTIVLVDGISPKAIAKAILDNGVTAMMAVASIYASMVKLDELHTPNLGRLRLAESGGMHVVPTLAQRFKERFGIPITPVWGSTETTGIIMARPWNGVLKTGSVGKPCPYYEVALVGDDGEIAGANDIGELIVNGPAVCSGYHGNPEETALHMKDGWMHTGDLFWKDDDGYFFFAGRRTGMMKVAGLKVFPSEIEDVISGHPDVVEVAVVRTVDSTHGEVPKAVVVLKENSRVDADEIVRYCTKRLARYKVPRIIEFTKELPKTPGGKILYKKL
jgi:long-chain acyl-CoA synthetase